MLGNNLFTHYQIMPNTLSNYLCKLLLVLADINEAKSLIQDFTFSQTANNFYQCRDSHMSIAMDMIILDQWGENGVLQALENIKLENYDSCVNIGFAGTCSPHLPLQTCYTIDKVSLFREDSPTLCNLTEETSELTITTIPNLLQANLVSVRAPYRQGFHDTLQLVDMEGYSIAKLCKHHNLRCMMIKIASDYTTKEGGDYLNQHKSVLAKKLSSAFSSSFYNIIESSIPSQI